MDRKQTLSVDESIERPQILLKAVGLWLSAVICSAIQVTPLTEMRLLVLGFFLNLIPWDGDWTSPCNHTLLLQVHSIELAYRCHCVTHPTQDNKDPECSAQRGQYTIVVYGAFTCGVFVCLSLLSVWFLGHAWLLLLQILYLWLNVSSKH